MVYYGTQNRLYRLYKRQLRQKRLYRRYKKAKRARKAPRRGFSFPNKNLRVTGTLGIEKGWSTYYFPADAQTNGAKIISPIRQVSDLTLNGLRIDPKNEAPSATTGNLFIIPQGDGPTDRTGNRIVIKMLYINGSVIWPLTAQVSSGNAVRDNDAIVHILLVADSQSNGQPPVFSDIFEIPPVPFNHDGIGMTLQRNLINSTRFKILKHLVMRKPNSQTTGGYSSSYPTGNPNVAGNVGQMPIRKAFRISKKMNFPVTYNYGTTGVMNEIVDNSLHLFAWYAGTDSSYSEFSNPRVSYSVRFRFYG